MGKLDGWLAEAQWKPIETHAHHHGTAIILEIQNKKENQLDL